MPELRGQILAATKWCVFSKLQQAVTEEWVLGAVHERSRRLGGRVELLQFHWYDVRAASPFEPLACRNEGAHRFL